MSDYCRWFRHPSTMRLVLSLVVCLGAVAACPSVVRAQAAPASFTWDTVDKAFDEYRHVVTQKTLKNEVIYGRQSLGNNRPAMDNWYRSYLFPSMATAAEMGEIYDRREELTKDMESAADATVHQYLVDMAYEEATKRVLGDYHPSVRYNAMLIIVGLNQAEARIAGSERFPAVRLPKALDFAVDEFKKPNQLDVIQLAALLGMQRHVRLARQRPQDAPIQDSKKAEIAALAQSLVTEKTPPANRTPAGQTWLRRAAVEVLSAVGAVGDGQTHFNSLVAIVADNDEPLSLRCAAARALEDLEYTDVAGIDGLETARQLGALAAFACRQEDARVKDEVKTSDVGTKPGGSRGGYPGMGGGGYPGMGGGGGAPGSGPPSSATEENGGPDDQVNAIRRRLKLPLHCVLLGLRGTDERSGYSPPGTTASQRAVLGLAADESQKAEMQKIIDAVDAIVEATDKFDKGIDAMMQEVRSKTRDLETLLPKAAAAADQPAVENALPGGAPAAKEGAKTSGKAKKG